MIGIFVISGAIAQMVEHLHGMQGASGSSPLGSIIKIVKSIILNDLIKFLMVKFISKYLKYTISMIRGKLNLKDTDFYKKID